MPDSGKPKPKLGRRCLLTPEMHEKIIAYIRDGNYYEVACAACGICEKTLYTWRENGEADIASGKDTKFSQFLLAISQARAEAQTMAVRCIRKGFNDDWRAGVVYLERTDSQRWGRRDRLDVDSESKITYVIETGVPSPVNFQAAKPSKVRANGNGNGNRHD